MGQDLAPAWKLFWLVVGAYHAVVGGLAIREHLTNTGEIDPRFAWSNAAAYALMAPLLLTVGLLLIGYGLSPFPSNTAVISGAVDRFWADEDSSEAVYRLRLQGLDREFHYRCANGRHGWCSDHTALESALTRQPMQAQVIPLKSDIVGLVLDGEELVSRDSEQFDQRTLPLIMGLMAAAVGALFAVECVGWGRQGLTLRAEAGQKETPGVPKIIE
jgi:hypothetical protein